MPDQIATPATDQADRVEAGRHMQAAASWHPEYDRLVVADDGALWLECTCGCGNSDQLSFPQPMHCRATLEWIAWAATNAGTLLTPPPEPGTD